MGIKFKELKNCLAKIERISICFEDSSYENYFSKSDIPDIYDDLYVYGIGIIESEFPPFEKWSGEGSAWDGCISAPVEFAHCLEIVLRKEPRALCDVNIATD